MYVKELFIPIYKVQLIVVIHDDLKVVQKKYNLEYSSKEENDNTFAFCEYNKSKDILNIHLVFKPDYFNYFYIGHELYHVVSFITNLRGIEHDINNEEPSAYIQGYLFEELMNIYTLYKIEKDKEASELYTIQTSIEVRQRNKN